MNKKVLAVVLTLTHLMCIVLGYCIATMHLMSVASAESTTDVTETGTLESATQTIPEETEIKEYVTATEEPIIFTEATEEPTEATEATEAEDIPVYTPPVTTPPATQPPATDPPVTQPLATEPPPAEKTEEQAPSYDSSNDLGDF